MRADAIGEVKEVSGVIDENGQQWERCNGCGDFERIEALAYEEPSKEFEYGRDLCQNCVFDLARGLTARLEARRGRVKAAMAEAHERNENRVEKQWCGHTQRHGSAVYRFKDVPTGDPNVQETRCRTYCSEACADADEKEFLHG